MNERIKELAKQAGFYISIDGSGVFIPDPHTEDITETAKKFAELIVQECMNVLYENELWNRHISYVLKEHFGVEE